MENMNLPLIFRRTAGILLVLSLLSVLTACSTPAGGAPTESTAQDAQGQTTRKNIALGSGSFNYSDPKAGLAELSGYTATLSISFEGTRAGNPAKWSQVYTMQATKDPPAKQWKIERENNGTAADPLLRAEMNGLEYEKRGEGACTAKPIQQEDPLSQRLEPASFLSGVIGAEEAGAEEVNTIAATHYKFDQRALGEDGLNQSVGELWVATDGSYLVKYLLTTTAGPDYFGKGVDGTLKLDYELTAPNAPLAIALPDDCPPGLVDAPQLPDATNVHNSPGVLTYDSPTSLADAAAFYEKQLPPLGWSARVDPIISDTTAMLNYTREDQAMIVTIETGPAGSSVTIFTAKNQAFP